MASISQYTLTIIIAAALVIVGIQVWGNYKISQHSDEILKQIESLPQEQLAGEKARQEVIAIKIETEAKALSWTGLVGSVGTMVAVFGALIGLWQGLRQYWANKEKERLDRAATDLSGMWVGLANADPRVRAGAVVGLQHYLTSDKSEYHSRILSALVVAARLEETPEVLNTIAITLQKGMTVVPWEITHRISWQKVKLKHVNLAGLPLCEFDFRDADLEDADLRDCHLCGALFNAANLKGARLDRSNLTGANLEYADLAGASMTDADLAGCRLDNAKVLNTDLEKADLSEAVFDPEEINWRLTRNWRHANLGDPLRKNLVTKYGPDVTGRKVLMMLWEYPPLAVGGAWTAAYHIIQNLRRQGADLVVMVPWKRSELDLSIFGNDIEFISLEIVPPLHPASIYAREQMSDYCSPFSPYDRSSSYQIYSPYGRSSPYQVYSSYDRSSSYQIYSPYGRSSPYQVYSSYDRSSPYQDYSPYRRSIPHLKPDHTHERQTISYRDTARLLREGPISGMVREFQYRALRHIRRESTGFDVVYASDWPTFWAAEEVSRETDTPWIAHFHSTENDRRQKDPDEVITAIERRGARSADRIVTPSRFTSGEVSRLYDVPSEKITVMPNPLSQDDIPVSELGSFETRRVIFLGRLARQKGPELFVKTCSALDMLQSPHHPFHYAMFGSGEEYPDVMQMIHDLNVNIPHSEFADWESRGTAFGNASALLVTSHAEPFGMVILEAMERGVPVLYPEHAGAAEVLKSGIQITPEETVENARHLNRLLTDRKYWEGVVEKQNGEIKSYYSKGYEEILMQLFSEVSGKPKQGSPPMPRSASSGSR